MGMFVLNDLGRVADGLFRTFMRDAGFETDDPRLKKIFFAGFMFGAIEAFTPNGNRGEFRRQLRGLQMTVQQMLDE